ncbi:unnamed protein product [Calicophoron daubneyi]|uniref:Uncharacterized protein n=1 Tax=Calicophoron daubneyi TaxID=300641 RepID=A0AAV2TRB4_CALDB
MSISESGKPRTILRGSKSEADRPTKARLIMHPPTPNVPRKSSQSLRESSQLGDCVLTRRLFPHHVPLEFLRPTSIIPASRTSFLEQALRKKYGSFYKEFLQSQVVHTNPERVGAPTASGESNRPSRTRHKKKTRLVRYRSEDPKAVHRRGKLSTALKHLCSQKTKSKDKIPRYNVHLRGRNKLVSRGLNSRGSMGIPNRKGSASETRSLEFSQPTNITTEAVAKSARHYKFGPKRSNSAAPEFSDTKERGDQRNREPPSDPLKELDEIISYKMISLSDASEEQTFEK